MNYDEELFWKRVDNLSRAMKIAQDPSFKRLWEDKLQLLLQNQPMPHSYQMPRRPTAETAPPYSKMHKPNVCRLRMLGT